MIVDSSITLAWFFEDESSDYADSVRSRLSGTPMFVPTVWAYQVANGLLEGERRGRTSPAKRVAFLNLLDSLPIVTDESSTPLAHRETSSLARQHGLSIYDAAYLELALRLGQPLATLDRKLRSAAESLGVAVVSEREEPSELSLREA
jgi:predicted nucleic acid-binding protein